MRIRKLFTLFVCGISILYTSSAYTKTIVHEADTFILQKNTDLNNIEDISRDIFKDITRKIPLNMLKESTIFIPEVTYTSNNIPVQTVFDTVFTQALIATFVNNGVSIASSAEKKKILIEYENLLQKKLEEKADIEKKTAQEIKQLQSEVIEKKASIIFMERELNDAQTAQKQHQKHLFNAKRANTSLLSRHEANKAKENQNTSDIRLLEKTIISLEKEIDTLTSALIKLNKELDEHNKAQENAQSTTENKESNNIAKENIVLNTREDNERMKEKITIAIEERKNKIAEHIRSIEDKRTESTRLQAQSPTMVIAIAQSKANIYNLESEYNERAKKIASYMEDIKKETKLVHSLENKIIALTNMNNIPLPNVYEVHISYTNAESVLFITAEVSSGLYHNTVYLAKYTARVSPYTAMLLQQQPLSIKSYSVRSATVQKPKSIQTQPVTISNERGLH